MNGVHDMGGMDGFGKVEIEPNEPVFHEKWEGRVMALVRAMGAAGAFNIDTGRFYREALPPHVYLSSSYYKKWLLGLTDNLVAKGFISASEVETGHAIEPAKPLTRGKLTPDRGSAYRPCDRTGEAIEARQAAPRSGVSRLPPRQFHARRPGAGEVQDRRTRALPQYQSRHPHPPAALCARAC